MLPACRSSSRCASVACEACRWRYSLRIARRIEAHGPRKLLAFEIACSTVDAAEFLRWRTSMHNIVAYRRRQSRWWRSVGIWGWWDGTSLRGIVSLGSITSTEFISALRRHGEIRLRPIGAENIRTEVYAAAMSISAASGPREIGRYQRVKIAIEPVIIAVKSMPIDSGMMVEAMPVLV